MDQEDLTASHWDDILSPSHQPFANLSSSNYVLAAPPLNNEFLDLNIHDHNESSESEDDNDGGINSASKETPHHQDDYDPIKDAEREQLHDIRNEHKNQLISELTSGALEDELEASVATPKKIELTGSLFNDKDSPIKVSNESHTTAADSLSSPKRSSQLKHGQFKAPRHRKYSAKINAKHLNSGKSANQDSQLQKFHQQPEADSLGPLGVKNDDNGANDKFSIKSNTRADQLAQEADAPLYDIPTTSEEERLKKISKPTGLDSTAKESSKQQEKIDDTFSNKLEITVGDPMKVGDITTAHIVYTIKTKTKNPQSKYWPADAPEEVVVTRRYKDFRWIYHQLQNNHPGRIVPPPPAKQTYIGRFNESFIEGRRLSLEKMLSKISNLVSLRDDNDFVMFLTSEDFNNEAKERERMSGLGVNLEDNGNNDELLSSNSSVVPIVAGSGSTGGFMSSLFSISNKINEPDEFFQQKKEYIEDLEYNLKNFYKSIELIGTQRVEMINVLEEISLTVEELASYEISKVTSDLLSAFSEIQIKLRDNLDRINLQDQLTLGFTVEEYLRIIESIKYVFETRIKIYQQYQNFKQDLVKKQSQLDKLNKKYKSSVDKINQLNFEVDKLKQKTTIYETKFNSISETIKQEIENFEIERIDDFRNSVEIFIESSIESQKEAIELWETFYERQNLASA